MAVLLMLVTACSGAPDSGPGEVAWGRDTCARCGMVVNDPRFAARIRAGERLATFDDLGCALLWLDEHPQAAPPEIWVGDISHGRWLDGYTAGYTRVDTTPMGYGWAATLDPERGTSSLEEVRARIREQSAPAPAGASPGG